MEWTEERRQLVSQLLADGGKPDQIAERFGVTARAIYAGMQRFGMVEHLRGTREFVTASGKRVRKQVKQRRPAKVTLARVNCADR